MATEEVKIVLTGEFKNKQAIVDAIKKIDKGVKDVSIQSQKTEKNVNSLSTSLKKLAKIVGLSILVKKFFDLGKSSLKAAGQMQQYNVAFKTMLGSATKAKTLMKDAIEFAAKTPFQLGGVLDATKQLLAYNTAQEDVIPTLRNLGDIAAGTGADIRLIAKAWGDVKTKGKLAGQEVLQFANAGVPLIKELANTFNLTTREVVDLQAKGQISFDMVNKAIQGMTAEGGKFFNLMDAQSKTFLGTVSNMQDGFFQVKVALGNALLPVAQAVVNKMINLFSRLHEWLTENRDNITSLVRVFGTMLKPVIVTLTTAVQALGIAFAFVVENMLAVEKAFKQLKFTGLSALGAIVGALAKISGSDLLKNMKLEIEDLKDETIKSVDEINAKLAKQKTKKEEKETKKEEDDKEIEEAQEKSDAIIEIEKAKNEALLQSELDFIQGKTTQKELEAEQDAIKREEEIALLQEDFITKLENQTLNDEQRLALKEEYETQKAEIDEKYKVSNSEFQKAFNVASAKVQAKADKMRIKAGTDLYTNLTSTIDAFAQHNKAMARAQQVISAGETIVATYLGATKAFAIGGGYPKGIPPMLATIAQGLGNLATINSQSFAVGASEIPQDMTAQIHAGEMIIPKSFSESIRAGELSLGGGVENQGAGGSQSTININFEGATFIGDINDEMLVEIGTRMGELINEDLLTPLPSGAV